MSCWRSSRASTSAPDTARPSCTIRHVSGSTSPSPSARPRRADQASSSAAALAASRARDAASSSGSNSSGGASSSTWWPSPAISAAASTAARRHPSSTSASLNAVTQRPTRSRPGSAPTSASQRTRQRRGRPRTTRRPVGDRVEQRGGVADRPGQHAFGVHRRRRGRPLRPGRRRGPGSASARPGRTGRPGCGSSRRCRWRGRPAPARPRRRRPNRRTSRPASGRGPTGCGSGRRRPARSYPSGRARGRWSARAGSRRRSETPPASSLSTIARHPASRRRPHALVVRLAGLLAAEVLEQERDTGEGPVGQVAARITTGPLELAMDHAVELRVERLDAGDRGVDELDGFDLAAPHQLGERSRRGPRGRRSSVGR